MGQKFSIFMVVFLAGLAAFLSARLLSSGNISYDSADELALANNSLINRFTKVEEKYLPPAGPVKLTGDDGYFLKLSPQKNEIYYYLPASGQLKSVAFSNLTSKDSPVSSVLAEIKPGFKKIEWSKTGQELIGYHDLGLIYHNLGANTHQKLDAKIKAAVFSNDRKIAYLYFNQAAGEGEIRIGDSTFENFKTVLRTRSESWQINWLNSGVLSLVNAGAIFTLDTGSGNLTKVLENKEIGGVRWSPNAEKLIYWVEHSPNAQVGFYNSASQQETFFGTGIAADQCVWSINNTDIYCPGPAGLKVIDTASGLIADLSSDPIFSSAGNLVLDSLENYLVFKNTQNGKLYYFHLKP